MFNWKMDFKHYNLNINNNINYNNNNYKINHSKIKLACQILEYYNNNNQK